VFETNSVTTGPLAITDPNLAGFQPVFRNGYVSGVYSNPVWSPDDKKIAFSFIPLSVRLATLAGFTPAPPEFTQGIYVVNPDGQQMTKAIDLPEGGSLISWSLDGKRLLYLKQDEEQRYWICVANVDGTDEKRIKELSFPWEVAWSWDNTRLAFISGGREQVDLFVANADGGQVVNLTNNEKLEIESSVAWSRNGQHLAFTAFDGQQQRLYVMRADGTDKQLIKEDVNYASIDWSPDGKWLLVTEIRYGFESRVMLLTKLSVNQ